jgi:hypothetical protein
MEQIILLYILNLFGLENISVGSSNIGYSSLLYLNPPNSGPPVTNGCILDNTYPKIHND